jgi:hypothetical protein
VLEKFEEEGLKRCLPKCTSCPGFVVAAGNVCGLMVLVLELYTNCFFIMSTWKSGLRNTMKNECIVIIEKKFLKFADVFAAWRTERALCTTNSRTFRGNTLKLSQSFDTATLQPLPNK